MAYHARSVALRRLMPGPLYHALPPSQRGLAPRVGQLPAIQRTWDFGVRIVVDAFIDIDSHLEAEPGYSR